MKHLKELRLRNNLTQHEIAEKLNISRSAYTNYETDKRYPNKDILIKLSKIFDVSIEYLMDMEPRKPQTFNKDKFSNALFSGTASLDTSKEAESFFAEASLKESINNNPDVIANFENVNYSTTTRLLKGETDDPSLGNKKSPSELDELNDFQKTILTLLDCVPAERQGELVSLVESALKMSGLLK